LIRRPTENETITLLVVLLIAAVAFGFTGVRMWLDRNDLSFRATAEFRCQDSPDRDEPVILSDPQTGEVLGEGSLGYQLPSECSAPIDASNVDGAERYTVRIGRMVGTATARQLDGGIVKVSLQ